MTTHRALTSLLRGVWSALLTTVLLTSAPAVDAGGPNPNWSVASPTGVVGGSDSLQDTQLLPDGTVLALVVERSKLLAVRYDENGMVRGTVRLPDGTGVLGKGGRMLVVNSSTGVVSGVDARTGVVLWRYAPTGLERVQVALGRSAWVAGYRSTYGANRFVVQRLDATTGALLWEWTSQPRAGVVGSRTPRVAETESGDVVATSALLAEQGQIVCVDATTGQLRWQQYPPNLYQGLVDPSPLLIAGQMVGLNFGIEFLAFDARTGASRLGTYLTDDANASWTGDDSGRFFAVTSQRRVRAYSGGHFLWETASLGSSATPAVVDGSGDVLVGTSNGLVRLSGASGATRWTQATSFTPVSVRIHPAGRLLVFGTPGTTLKVAVHDLASGALQDTQGFAGVVPETGAATVASTGVGLVAAREPLGISLRSSSTGEARWGPVWHAALGSRGVQTALAGRVDGGVAVLNGDKVGLLDGATGALRWVVPAPSSGFVGFFANGDVMVAGFTGVTGNTWTVSRLADADGATVWTASRLSGHSSPPTSAAVSPRDDVFLFGRDASFHWLLAGWSGASGVPLFTPVIESSSTNTGALAFTPDGDPVVAGIASGLGALVRYDGASGTRRWGPEFLLNGAVPLSLAVGDGIYVTTTSAVGRFDLATGVRTWSTSFSTAEPRGRVGILPDGQPFHAGFSRATLRTLDPQTGAFAWSIPGLVAANPSLAIVPEGVVLSGSTSFGLYSSRLWMAAQDALAAPSCRAWSASVAAVGGQPPYHFVLAEGDLPRDLLLARDGSLTGTAHTPAVETVRVRVVDAAGATTEAPLTVRVVPAFERVIDAPSDRVEQGGSLTLSAPGGEDAVWSPGGEQALSITVRPTEATVYGVITTDAARCIAEDVQRLAVLPRAAITVSAGVAREGGSPVPVEVRLAAPAASERRLAWSTSDGEATAGVDYTASSGVLTFPAGATAQTLTIPILNDTIDEPEETFALSLAENGVTVSRTLIAIGDDDPDVVVSADSVSVVEGSVQKLVNVPLRLTRTSPTPLTVQWIAIPLTVSSDDFSPVTGTLTIPAGQTIANIVFTVAGDLRYEADEFAEVRVARVIGATAGASGQLVILNDDPYPARHDFDADGRSDLVWSTQAGTAVVWRMNGASVLATGSITGLNGGLTSIGSGDLDNDGRDDLFWTSANDASLVGWTMSGPARTGVYPLGTNQGEVLAVADLDGDGRADTVTRDVPSGAITLRRYSPFPSIPVSFSQTTNAMPTVVDFDWKVAAAADFDGDGRDDLLWRHASGACAMWLMDGPIVRSYETMGPVDTGWEVVAAGDFDGDRRSEIVWRNRTSGDVWMWSMNGGSVVAARSVGVVDPLWTLGSYGDFDGDGRTDLVWRRKSGATYMWRMDGASILAATPLPASDPTWTLAVR